LGPFDIPSWKNTAALYRTLQERIFFVHCKGSFTKERAQHDWAPNLELVDVAAIDRTGRQQFWRQLRPVLPQKINLLIEQNSRPLLNPAPLNPPDDNTVASVI